MPSRPHDPVAARLVDRALDDRLRRFLGSRGVPNGEIDEILSIARLQLYEQGLPGTPEEIDKLLFRIAHRRAMDYFRGDQPELLGDASIRAAFRRPRGPVEPPPVPADAERALDRLKDLAVENPRHATAFEAMKQKMNGKSLEQFAAEKGVAPGTLRQWMNRFRGVARKSLPRYLNFFVI